MVELFAPAFARAAGDAAIFEMKARLLADKTDADRKKLFKMKLRVLLKELGKMFGLDGVEQEKLDRACRLRNKVLHSDFCDARSIVVECKAALTAANVQKIDLESGSSVPVRDTSSTPDGGVFGWLMELGTSGAFDEAARIFREATGIIDRLIDEVDGVDS